MISTLLWILGSTIVVSLVSLVGIAALLLKEKKLDKMLLLMVGFAAGALMGGAFLHLIPEAIESSNSILVFLFVLIGFSLFFIIERVLKWRHCHKGHCDAHTFTHMSLIGDSVHNFIDGLIIAASFAISVPFGIVTTLIIIAHEVPQEIGDFAILLYGGFNRWKALLFNFITALAAVAGGLIGYFISGSSGSFSAFLVPFAAGGFIYIAASDLIPELHKTEDLKKSISSLIFFAAGIIFMLVFKLIFGGV